MSLALWAGSGVVHAAEEEEDVLATVPGEILDTAILHCRMGEREQARAMFSAIREQLDPPPALLRLVNDLEASGCSASAFTPLRGPRIQVGVGYDSNVSQGITARTLTLGPPGDTVNLELDASFRPQASPFVHAGVDMPLALPLPGWTARLAGAVRRNESARRFDTASYGGSLTRTFDTGGGSSVRLQGDAADLWLGRTLYQRSAGLTAQGLVPGAVAGGNGLWIATGSVLRLQYATEPTQDAVHTEISIAREHRLNASLLAYVEAAVQYDHAMGARPGDDRRGYELVAGAVTRFGEWQLRPQLRFQQWNSSDLFAPGIIEERRRNRTWQATLLAERRLSMDQSLIVEWRSRIANDRIPLYQYRAHSLSVSLQHQF